MSAVQPGARSGTGGWILTGAIMGIIAGIVFMVFEMVVAFMLQGRPLWPAPHDQISCFRSREPA